MILQGTVCIECPSILQASVLMTLGGRIILSRALDKAPHINSGLGWARDVVTTKVDNSGDGQGPLGQGKADEKGIGLLRAVQG